MQSYVLRRPIVDGILITVAATVLILVAPPSSGARRASDSHARARNVSPPTSATAATAEALKRQNEILTGLEASQSALEKAVTDLNTAVPQSMGQLREDFTESHRDTQQLLQAMNQRIDSIWKWLRSFFVFFFLLLIGLSYFIFRPVRAQENSFKRQRKTLEMGPAENEITEWQNTEPANGRRPGIGRGDGPETAAAIFRRSVGLS
jgi:hypothetical protein